MILITYVTNKRGSNIYWDSFPKKYYIKEEKIHSTINITINDIKMKFVNICTSKVFVATMPSLSTIKRSNNCAE